MIVAVTLGLSVNLPASFARLRILKWVLRDMATIINPKTIHIAPGIYSSVTTGEYFPLYARSYVSLIGDDAATTILDGANKTKLLSMSNIENLEIRNITIFCLYLVREWM